MGVVGLFAIFQLEHQGSGVDDQFPSPLGGVSDDGDRDRRFHAPEFAIKRRERGDQLELPLPKRRA